MITGPGTLQFILRQQGSQLHFQVTKQSNSILNRDSGFFYFAQSSTDLLEIYTDGSVEITPHVLYTRGRRIDLDNQIAISTFGSEDDVEHYAERIHSTLLYSGFKRVFNNKLQEGEYLYVRD